MTAADVRARLDDRYGRRRRRWTGWVVVGVLAAIAVGYLSWTTLSTSANSVDADATAYDIVDAHSVRLHFQVTAQPNARIACALEADDAEHGVVGWKIVTYSADPAHTRAFVETIPTAGKAVTGLVHSCWIP